MKKIIYALFLLGGISYGYSQPNPGTCEAPTEGPTIQEIFRAPIGDAVSPDPGSHILTITRDKKSQRGAIWSKEKLDFNKNFKLDSYLYLGDEDKPADGITLTFQNDPRMNTGQESEVIGKSGFGLGAYGDGRKNPPVENAISFEADTYSNNGSNDRIDREINEPGEYKTPGHLAFVYPKESNNNYDGEHYSVTKATSDNRLSNNCWRRFRIIWSATTQTLTYELEGVGSSSIKFNPTEVFKDSNAYWGFTSSTGAYYQLNQIAVGEIPQATETVLRKYGRNVTMNTAETIDPFEAMPGDVVEYHLQAEYIEGWANWIDASIKDIIPAGVTVDESTITLNGQPLGKDKYSWEEGNILAVQIGSLGGNIGGGQEGYPLVADLKFNVKINDNVELGSQVINRSYAWGEWREIESNDLIINIPSGICYIKGIEDPNTPKNTGVLLSTLEQGPENGLLSNKNGDLVMESNNRGFILTRVPNVSVIKDPSEGMLVYDLSEKTLKYYTVETGWKVLENYCFPPRSNK